MFWKREGSKRLRKQSFPELTLRRRKRCSDMMLLLKTRRLKMFLDDRHFLEQLFDRLPVHRALLSNRRLWVSTTPMGPN